jgi:hypothetical protein
MKKMADFDKESFKKDVINNVKNLFRKTIDEATQEQVFQAVSYAVKDHIIDRWIATQKASHHHPAYNPKSLRDTLPSQTCHFRASQPHSNTFSVADIITRYNEKCIFRYICP